MQLTSNPTSTFIGFEALLCHLVGSYQTTDPSLIVVNVQLVVLGAVSSDGDARRRLSRSNHVKQERSSLTLCL